MCEKTADDVVARMALVPRTLEARGLDATPQIQAKLRQVGTPAALRAVDILDVILRDEVGHVAIGNRWYRWLCERDGLDPVAHTPCWRLATCAPRQKGPFNLAARRAAGFDEDELAALLAALRTRKSGSARRLPRSPGRGPISAPLHSAPSSVSVMRMSAYQAQFRPRVSSCARSRSPMSMRPACTPSSRQGMRARHRHRVASPPAHRWSPGACARR